MADPFQERPGTFVKLHLFLFPLTTCFVALLMSTILTPSGRFTNRFLRIAKEFHSKI